VNRLNFRSIRRLLPAVALLAALAACAANGGTTGAGSQAPATHAAATRPPVATRGPQRPDANIIKQQLIKQGFLDENIGEVRDATGAAGADTTVDLNLDGCGGFQSFFVTAPGRDGTRTLSRNNVEFTAPPPAAQAKALCAS
jgi:hypothetical protein